MNQEQDKFLKTLPFEIEIAMRECLTQSNYNPKWLQKLRWGYFGVIWEWTIKQGWWKEFISNIWGRDGIGCHFINPARFADAVYEYLKECPR